jgi:hypothetical protein
LQSRNGRGQIDQRRSRTAWRGFSTKDARGRIVHAAGSKRGNGIEGSRERPRSLRRPRVGDDGKPSTRITRGARGTHRPKHHENQSDRPRQARPQGGAIAGAKEHRGRHWVHVLGTRSATGANAGALSSMAARTTGSRSTERPQNAMRTASAGPAKARLRRCANEGRAAKRAASAKASTSTTSPADPGEVGSRPATEAKRSPVQARAAPTARTIAKPATARRLGGAFSRRATTRPLAAAAETTSTKPTIAKVTPARARLCVTARRMLPKSESPTISPESATPAPRPRMRAPGPEKARSPSRAPRSTRMAHTIGARALVARPSQILEAGSVAATRSETRKVAGRLHARPAMTPRPKAVASSRAALRGGSERVDGSPGALSWGKPRTLATLRGCWPLARPSCYGARG